MSRSQPWRHEVLRAREEERKYIARELHDQIIQSLIGLNYHLSTIRKYGHSDVEPHITLLQSDIRRVVDHIRRICSDLRPPVLDSLGLVAAIHSRLRDLERQGSHQIVLQLQEETDRPVSEAIAISVYRILHEALTNVQKHAAASRIVVRLHLTDTKIKLSIQDNGKGFEVPSRLDYFLTQQHFGLVGLREQSDLIKGVLAIVSHPGQGTCIQVTVALPPETMDEQLEMGVVYVESYPDHAHAHAGHPRAGGR